MGVVIRARLATRSSALDVRDCSTCALATAHDDGVLCCTHDDVTTLGSPVLDWRCDVANLDALGFIETPVPAACPGWGPAWGSE